VSLRALTLPRMRSGLILLFARAPRRPEAEENSGPATIFKMAPLSLSLPHGDTLNARVPDAREQVLTAARRARGNVQACSWSLRPA
jgi:hypothetical protein